MTNGITIDRLDKLGKAYYLCIDKNNIDEGAIDQFEEAMALPCNVRGFLAPDYHRGYTLPIGAVIKSKGVVFPSYVGYDIGCGLAAMKLNITKEGLDLNQLRDDILAEVPIGFNWHKDKMSLNLDTSNISVVARKAMEEVGAYQLGTLGGGNHFIEIGESIIDGNLWLVIHSGSRGFGHKVAEHYMKMAAAQHQPAFDVEKHIKAYTEKNEGFLRNNPDGFQKAMDKYICKMNDMYVNSLKDFEGHYGFSIKSPEGKAYLADMATCINYAVMNRTTMMNEITKAIRKQKRFTVIEYINRNHNHAEAIDGDYVIHRKGATHAEKGMYGIIPANMRDGSYIVQGLGNPDSMCSSSHGAGRLLSRAQAKKQLNLDKFHEELSNVVTNHTDAMLDEAPDAYKDIEHVMANQEDLVRFVDKETPILNIKG